MKKIGLISLGCDKNRVDSEILLSSAFENNYEIVVNPEDADVLVVNTCAFIESAKQEAIEAIFDLVNVKNVTGAKLVVTGCLAQRYPQQLFDEIPEIDAILGADNYARFADVLNKLFQNPDKRYYDVSEKLTTVEQGNRILTTPSHYAYLKIADGCDNCCTYCAIPKIRGRYRSRKMEDIIAEAKKISAEGSSELILVAQDVTDYGKDLYGVPYLVPLIDEISKIDEVQTIRLLYCYPEHVTDELIDCIATNQKVAKYIDLPLQHVNDEILRRMNRKISKQEIIDVINKLKENVWGIAIRTTFICGFPGEKEEHVKELNDFLIEHKLTNVGFFEYSQEEGTPAANYPDQVEHHVKSQRLNQLVATQYKIVAARNLMMIGVNLKVVVDVFCGNDERSGKYLYSCRSREMAPQIDGVVYLYSQVPLNIGEKLRVKIVAYNDYDLIAEVE